MPGSNRYFQKDGIVTAGNASGINDGAGFLLDTTAGKARVLGLPIAGQLISFAIVGVDPAYMGTGPIPSIRQALKKADLTVDDIAVFEINEAFAPMP